MDFDDFNPDDEIGRVILPIRDLDSETTQDMWLDVDLHTDEESAAESKVSLLLVFFAMLMKELSKGGYTGCSCLWLFLLKKAYGLFT